MNGNKNTAVHSQQLWHNFHRNNHLLISQVGPQVMGASDQEQADYSQSAHKN